MMLSAADTSAAFARRVAPGRALATSAVDVARACHAMAERFQRGGTLYVFGNGTSATDAAHIAVEFVHPVVVGKRALPAMSLTNDAATLTAVARSSGFDSVFGDQLMLRVGPDDIALGLSSDGRCRNVLLALESAHRRGALTVAMVGGDGGDLATSPAVTHALVARADDPLIVKEIHVTTYHVLWELVHVFFEHPGARAGETG
jgi:D-sedoheptulose 7-phosphate isomerase